MATKLTGVSRLQSALNKDKNTTSAVTGRDSLRASLGYKDEEELTTAAKSNVMNTTAAKRATAQEDRLNPVTSEQYKKRLNDEYDAADADYANSYISYLGKTKSGTQGSSLENDKKDLDELRTKRDAIQVKREAEYAKDTENKIKEYMGVTKSNGANAYISKGSKSDGKGLKGMSEVAYRYISDPEYKKALDAGNQARELTGTESLALMNDDEKNAFLYYIGKGDTDKANEYMTYLYDNVLSQRGYEKVQQDLYQEAQDNPLKGAVSAVLTAPLQIAGTIGAAYETARYKATGEYRPLSKNKLIQAAGASSTLSEGTTSEMGGVGSFLTSTGISIAQFMLAAGSGNAALATSILSSQAAGATAYDAAQKGATPSEALSLSLQSGITEYATEKIPMDNLYKIVKATKAAKVASAALSKSTIQKAKDTVLEVLVQSGIEGTEEIISEIVNNISEVSVLGGRSEFEIYKQQLIDSGKTLDEAESEAALKYFVINPLVSGLSGALSGGLVGVSGVAAGNLAANADPDVKAQQLYDRAQKKNPTTEQEAATPFKTTADETLPEQGNYKGTVPFAQSEAQGKAEEVYQSFSADMGTTEAATQSATSTQKAALAAKRVADAKNVEEAADIVQRVGSTQNAVELSKTIGESGSVALERNMTEYKEVGDETFTPAFARYYRAGMLAKNAPFTALQNQLGTEISGTAQEAAYEAGRADAARVKETAFFGKNAGLVRDVEYYKAGVDEKNTRRLDALAKITGIQIKFKDEIKTADGKLANASLSDGVLYIARSSKDPFIVAAIHETVHRLRQADPESYNAINKAIWDIAEATDAPAVIAKIEGLKKAYGVTSADFAEEEYTAQAMGVVLNDGKVLDKFVENSPTGARKIISAIKDLITKIKNFITKNEIELDKGQMQGYDMLLKDAEKLEAAFSDALERQKVRAAEVEAEQEITFEVDENPFATEEVKYSLREGNPPEKTKIGYKVFVARNGKLYPPMAMSDKATPVGVWLDAEIAPTSKNIDGTEKLTKTGRPQMQAKGGTLAFRPGWHLGEFPIAPQFYETDKTTGERVQHPNFVWAECEFAADEDYQDEAMSYGMTKNGKFQHSLAGLPKVPKDGYYTYRTNPNPETIPWFISGAMKVTRILTDAEVDQVLDENGITPMKRLGGTIDLKKFGFDKLTFDESSDIRYSLRDSEGNALTEAQAEFFRDSKVRNEFGNLMRVFTGTDSKFNEFKTSNMWGYGGTYFSRDKIVAESFGKRIVEAYVNLVNPFIVDADGKMYDSIARPTEMPGKGLADTQEIAAFARDNGYDGLIVRDVREAGNITDDIIAFSPNQIKKTTNKNPTADPDIRYSLRYQQMLEQTGGPNATADDARKLAQINSMLKERISDLKEQMKTTKAPTTDKNAVEQYVKQLLKTESSSADADSITERLLALYDYIVQGGDDSNLAWSEAKSRARGIAKDIVESTSVLVRDTYEEYAEMRSFLHTTAVSISEQDKGDFRDGEFNALRKKNMGKLLITKNGTPIDTLWMEMQDQWPEMFSDGISHNADKLRHMADVVNSLGQIYENPNDADLNSAIEYMSDELLNNYFEMPQTKATFADRAAKKLIQQKDKGARKLEEVRTQRDERIAKILKEAADKREKMLDDVRKQRDRQIDNLKEKYAEKDQNRRERQTKTSVRGKIKRAVEKLKTMTLRPSDTQHIPEGLRKAVASFIGEIDISSDSMGIDTIGKLYAAQRELAKIEKSDVGFAEIDPDLELNIEALEPVLKSKRLNEMSLAELDTLWKITSAIQSAVVNYNKMFNENERRFVSDLGKMAMSDLNTVKGYNEHALSGARWLADTLNMDMLAPADYFEQLGSTMSAFYSGIRDGLDKKISHTKTAADYMRELLGEADIDEWSGKKAKSTEYELSSGKISLTPAQVMSLYLLNRQEKAQNHMFEGGVKAAPIVERRGKDLIPTVTKSYEVLRLAPEDVAKITGSLSEEQIRIAEGISRFFADYTAEWGNEVSLQMYGYQKFTEENYFPIVSDKNYVSQVYGETTDATLKNMGVTKARVAGANNPLIIEDVFDVYTRQADQMANYNAFVIPLTDIQKIWNYRNDGGSVKQFVEKKFGSRALGYFSKLITDINGGARVDRWASGIGSLIGKYKAARVGLNLRVVIQQPTTYLRAMAMIDAKYLAKGAAMKPHWDRVLKYAPIAQWKDWGYFNLDTGKSMRDIFLNKKTLSDYTMHWASKADQAAWSGLWNATELEIADTRSDLEKGSDAFYQAVGKRFSEIIDRTQVVDSVLHRPQILRSTDGLTKMATAFMNEPMKAYNMLRTAAHNAIEQKTPEAKAKLARVAFAFVVTATVNSLAAALIDSIRDDEDEEWWKRYLNAVIDNMIDVIPGMFPVLKDVFSLFSGYSVKRMDMAAIENLISAGRRTFSDKYTVGYKVLDVSSKLADLFGVPLSNAKRDISAFASLGIEISGNTWVEYIENKLLNSITSSANKGLYYDLAFKAYQSDDMADYKRITKDMIANGFESESIDNAMYARVRKTPEFQEKYQKNYDALEKRIRSNAYFKKLDDESKAMAIEMADRYSSSVVAEAAYDKEPTAWVRKAQGGKSVGVEPAEYILYKLALETVGDGNNSITQQEAADAINMLKLTEEEKEYIWQSQNEKWKSTNNPFSDDYAPNTSSKTSSTPSGIAGRKLGNLPNGLAGRKLGNLP